MIKQFLNSIKLLVIITVVFGVWHNAHHLTITTVAESEITGGISISPVIMESEMERGKSYEFTMSVANQNTDVPIELYPLIQKFEAPDDGNTPITRVLEQDDPIRTWVRFEQDKFVFAPKESKEIKFVVTLPMNTQPGSYFLTVTYETRNVGSGGTQQIIINQQISSLLFITVQGEITRDSSIDYFRSNKKIVDPFFDQLVLTYQISTKGNAYLKPNGNILIGENPNNPDTTLALNPKSKIILPNKHRVFNHIFKPTIPLPFLTSDESQNVKGEIIESEYSMPTLKKEKFESVLIYVGTNGQITSETKTIEVFFFPYKLISCSILAIVALIILYIIIKKLLSLSSREVKKKSKNS